jgi:hypothetical protein
VLFDDVTSSSIEGAGNARAAFGDHRATKAGQTQRVLGVMTTGTGEP